MATLASRISRIGYGNAKRRQCLQSWVGVRRFASSGPVNGDSSDKGYDVDDEDPLLHPKWRALERQLRSRSPRRRGEGVPEGRRNLKPSEEEFWYEAGVYEEAGTTLGTSSRTPIAPGEASCARLSTVKASAENHPLIVDLYKKDVAPVLQVKGFCGAQVFSDRAAGTVQSLTLWRSWGDLETAVANPRYAKGAGLGLDAFEMRVFTHVDFPNASEAMRSLQKYIETPPDIVDTEVACSILPTTGGGERGDVH